MESSGVSVAGAEGCGVFANGSRKPVSRQRVFMSLRALPGEVAGMEVSLTCAVCLSLFEEPVTLPVCSHNFCRRCLAECFSAAETTPAAFGRASTRATQTSDGGGGGGGGGGTLSVPCPLCRKRCPLPPEGGVASLPVNTTLAEVVKLFRTSQGAQGEAGPAEGSSALAPQLAALRLPCEKHPDRPLQLFCRMCLRAGCGQCVSEEHRGLFHAVNLIDVVYQEEKLAFFSNLKKIRELQANLLKETTSSKNAEVVMQNEEEIIKTEFEKVHNALETRMKQLLEDLESQKKWKEKEYQIWKRMKDVHRKTIENVLNDCEKILDECNPQHFLEVACSLNQRMETQLDLMQLASKHENQPEDRQRQMDTTSVINDILALNLTAVNLDADTDIPPSGSVCPTSANYGNKWEDKKNKKDAFCPMAGEDTDLFGISIPTRYMSVSAGAEFGDMSHEEMRYNYYREHQMHPSTSQTQAPPVNENHTLPKFLFSESISVVPICLTAKAEHPQKQRIQVLERQSIKEAVSSNSVSFTFEAVNLNFSGSNNNLPQLNVKEPQNDSKESSLSKNSKNCMNAATNPLLPAVTVPSEMHLPSTLFSKVPVTAATSAPTLSLCPLDGAAEQPTAPLDSNPSGNFITSKGSGFLFEKTKVFPTLFIGKSVSQDCNASNINGYNSSDSVGTATTTITGSKPVTSVGENASFSAFSTSSKSECFQKTKLSTSDQTSFTLPFEKIQQENKASCFSMETNKEQTWLVASSAVSSKDLVCNSGFTSNLLSDSALDQRDASKKQAIPAKLSPSCSWTSNDACLFSFKGARKSPFNRIKYVNVKSEMKSKEKYLAAKTSVPSIKDVPTQKGLEHLVACSSSIDNSSKSQTANMLVPQENVSDSANSTLTSTKLTKMTNTSENHVLAVEDQKSPSVPKEASCIVNSDSDGEDLSQASSLSESSTISEYFSLAEDNTFSS
ncbi:tripartite motif-containing protein 75 isoform X2 [Anolis carolinensis]|uniref:RING-type domain-containing protein n=1 Tax=Anolis carolinensis TaxID=28377 RepID=A0A803TDF1_ANOCA|nr:PREDICTED: uncharacterized protein LOC100552012 isoform X2 [Anolis carolinensis]|eukprot:XP_003223761.2 PREDICTED: uncharacterized protein LOC100552012 isoform X2 [Anolis carolinensis]